MAQSHRAASVPGWIPALRLAYYIHPHLIKNPFLLPLVESTRSCKIVETYNSFFCCCFFLARQHRHQTTHIFKKPHEAAVLSARGGFTKNTLSWEICGLISCFHHGSVAAVAESIIIIIIRGNVMAIPLSSQSLFSTCFFISQIPSVHH